MSKVGSIFFCCSSSNKYNRLDAKLGRKMVEVKRNSAGHDNFKSLNGIILRFPQFKEGLQNIRGVFEQYDEDSNGSIDREELKKCLQQLQMHMTEEEVEDLFHSCDIDGSAGIQFNEFIVLLCLIYLLKDEHSLTVRTKQTIIPPTPHKPTFLFPFQSFMEVCYRNQSWVHLNLKQLLTQSSKLSYF